MAYSPFVLAQTVCYGQIMCIYPAKWVPVGAIAFFETCCDISQNAKQLISGQTVSATGMCAYTCLFSCSVVLTLEVWDLNSRLHDTDHHPSYPSPGLPRTLLCIWRRLWALVHRSTHRSCKPSHIFFCHLYLIPANDRLLGYVNSCREIFALRFSPLHQFSAGASSLTSPSVASPSPPLFSYSRYLRPSDPMKRTPRGLLQQTKGLDFYQGHIHGWPSHVRLAHSAVGRKYQTVERQGCDHRQCRL